MIAWGRLLYLSGSAGVSVAAACYGSDWLKDNKDALASILAFFSVLAGFLVAAIALAADDRNVRGTTWRGKHYSAETIRKRLLRYHMLFMIYLTACFLAFVSSLKMGLSDDHQAWLNGSTLGVTIFAFLLSFSLPAQLSAAYMRRLKALVDDAKRPKS